MPQGSADRLPCPGSAGEDVHALQQLAGHVHERSFITKFRKIFFRDEMNDNLEIVPAHYGDETDESEYEELLPVSPL
jgi:hypothetical protein